MKMTFYRNELFLLTWSKITNNFQDLDDPIHSKKNREQEMGLKSFIDEIFLKTDFVLEFILFLFHFIIMSLALIMHAVDRWLKRQN